MVLPEQGDRGFRAAPPSLLCSSERALGLSTRQCARVWDGLRGRRTPHRLAACPQAGRGAWPIESVCLGALGWGRGWVCEGRRSSLTCSRTGQRAGNTSGVLVAPAAVL